MPHSNTTIQAKARIMLILYPFSVVVVRVVRLSQSRMVKRRVIVSIVNGVTYALHHRSINVAPHDRDDRTTFFHPTIVLL